MTDYSGEVCIPNISPAERRKRLTFGVVAFVAAVVILAVLLATGVDRLWRLPLLVLFWVAASGFFQWRDKTCVALARVDLRKTGDKAERIEDAAELAQVRRQARQVQLKALVVGVLLTLVAVALPSFGG